MIDQRLARAREFHSAAIARRDHADEQLKEERKLIDMQAKAYWQISDSMSDRIMLLEEIFPELTEQT